jgi:hypothetical protein
MHRYRRAFMMRELNNTIVQKEDREGFLEASILSAHKKFFEGNLNERFPFDRDDFMLYNTIIMYFKGNS